MSINIESLIKDDVLIFLQEVVRKTKGYDVYLGGGYLRDQYFQRYCNNGNTIIVEPKDIDIFFIPQNSATEKELPVIEKTYINYDINAKDIPNVRPNVKRVRGLFNSTLTTKDIQLIEYENPMSMRELAEDMDCNLNQIMYKVGTGLGYATDNFYNGFEDNIIMMLHTFDTERMFGRVQRMMKKFPTFTVAHNIPISEWERLCYEMGRDKYKSKKRVRANGSFIADETGNF